MSAFDLAAARQSIGWVTGAGGLIGHHLVQTAPRFAPAWNVCGLTRVQLDLLDFARVRQEFQEQRPQLIIHCAAMSRSPECQAKPELARQINVDVTALLAELAADIPLVFFSTDLVFDGKSGGYHEPSPVNPLSVYAETKVAAEKIVLANPRHLVIRTSLNAGTSPTGDRAFNEQMRLAWQRGERLRLFTDEFRSPIPAAVTARATWELINEKETGLFHVAGRERSSRYEIGKRIAVRRPELLPQIEPASCKDFQNPPRPPDTTLNCMKAQSVLSFQLPAFSEWLRDHPNELI
ncbi:MAG: SDR family oxidoreductase [Pedosphaera sp.]|nr:SDR family oxidoreductase [Pedosphaera sp.]